jgi:hypothetical protein
MGRDLSGTPVETVFQATQSAGRAGIYIHDFRSRYNDLAATAALCESPRAVSPYPEDALVTLAVTLRLEIFPTLAKREAPLSSRTVTLFAPFADVVDLPVNGLEIGRFYTLRLTDLSPTAEPKYWVLPTTEDLLHPVVFKNSSVTFDAMLPKNRQRLSRRVDDILITDLVAPIV